MPTSLTINQQKEKLRQELNDRANHIVSQFYLDTESKEQLKQAIINAMNWARTQ